MVGVDDKAIDCFHGRQMIKGITDEWSMVDGNHWLREPLCEGLQACAEASAENESFHVEGWKSGHPARGHRQDADAT